LLVPNFTGRTFLGFTDTIAQVVIPVVAIWAKLSIAYALAKMHIPSEANWA
jgi:hypothetical protein